MTTRTRSAIVTRGRRSTATLAATLLFLTLGTAFSPAATADDTPTPNTPAPTAASASKDEAAFEDGRYIVTLRDEAVATYGGGTGSFSATRAPEGEELAARSKRAVAYADHLGDEQAAVAESVGADIISSYTLATNGFSSTLTADQAAALAADSRVLAVVTDELLHLHAAVPSTEFLGLSGDGGVWNATGGVDSAGEGVVVGIIDSGVAPENPSFAGEPLGDAPGGEPYRDGESIVFDKADGARFRGACVTGQQFTADDCSTKLIGARYFLDNFQEESIGADRAEYVSPRDGNGHGSHTASTAAGNHGVSASVAGRELGEISGVAPAAKIAVYKACWSGPTPQDDGCATGDLLAAIDAAVLDGVDVINYSIGAGAAFTTVSLTDQAFLRAAAAGIFVAASAGNDGPDASTADNAAPWITTVAASTIPSYEASVRLGDGRTFLGGSITVPAGGSLEGPLLAASAIGVAGAEEPRLCGPGTLDPARAAGTIVLCERGVVDRVAKSAEVARVGGIGMVLVNPGPNSIDLDDHTVPTVHLDGAAYEAVGGYAATAGASVTLEDGNTTGGASAPTPQVAGFSSRGPILADGGDVLKPDVAAPGVAILADAANAEGDDPRFQLLSGTSMASPHVAGLAALYLGERPNASPSEVKSALMTTAYDTVDGAGEPVDDPFLQGAGHVDPTRYFEPGFLYLNDLDDWYGYVQGLGFVDVGVEPVDPSNLNLASISVGALAGVETITRTVTATAPGHYEVQPVDLPGVEVSVAPAMLDFAAAGDELAYTVTFRRTDAPLDAFTTGTLRWAGADGTVTTPLAVRPVVLSVPSDAAGSGVDGSLEIPVSAGDTLDVPIAVDGLVECHVLRGRGTEGGARDRHVIEVPDGTTYARFDLDAADDTADLDLRLYQLDPYGSSWLSREATTPNADEQIVMPLPSSGRYVVEVDFFAGAGDLDYELIGFFLGGEANVGDFSADPAVLPMRLGEAASVAVSWSGLAPGSRYLGRVHFGDTTRVTNVVVSTPGQPAGGDEELAVTVAPQWVRPGKSFSIEAVGLAPAGDYTISLDGESFAAGRAANDGEVSRYLSVPADAAEGTHLVRIEADGGHAEAELHVANLIIYDLWEFVDYGADGSATAGAEITFGGIGPVRVVIESAGGAIALDETLELSVDPMFEADSRRSSAAPVVPGDYTARVWAIAGDGSQTQQGEYAFTVAETEPDAVTMTQNPDNENAMDLIYENTTGDVSQATMRYKMCSGPLVFATVWIDQPVITGTFDMTAMTGVEFLLDGEALGAYANHGSERCVSEPKISNDFWATMSATDASSTLGAEGATAAENAEADATAAATPITLTASNRYPAYSRGFDFSVGHGWDIYQGRFHREEVPHDQVLEPGPVESRTIQVEEDAAFWVRAKYEVLTPDIHISAHRVIFTTPVSLAQLAPVEDEEPGGPTDPGNGGSGGGAPGSPSAPAAGGGSGLAHTGVELGSVVAIAALVAVLGGMLVVAGTRRRRGGRI
ncbi:S8 family serine peptidase [Agromyces ramosus]|uniref:Subtilisin family serine protease n=1 Tax=Agromyces ramosus TaxID=33879 RepID=A0ABU0RAX8_9MICO|nr:S8 family serine peptidase [Agromyces ramosus]MDQ0894907.1 subtilisin family serine protease [Agromyces ramosus]